MLPATKPPFLSIHGFQRFRSKAIYENGAGSSDAYKSKHPRELVNMHDVVAQKQSASGNRCHTEVAQRAS